MITAVSVAQTTVTIASSLRSQSYSQIANEAVQAGIAYATSCLNKTSTSYWTNNLTPQTNCTGTSGSGNNYITQNSQYTSTFAVAPPDTSGSKPKASVTGTVTLAGATKQYVAKGVAIVNVASAPTSTTLPTSPVDGQEVYYKIYVNGKLSGATGLWHLRYDASTGYWNFLGGPSLKSVDATVYSSATTTWTPTTAYVYLPLDGEYDVNFGSQLLTDQANALNQMQVGLFYNTAANKACYFIAVSLYNGSSVSCESTIGGITGTGGTNKYFQIRYMSLSGQQSGFYPMYVEATPLRVK
jgi:hypothetical protein